MKRGYIKIKQIKSLNKDCFNSVTRHTVEAFVDDPVFRFIFKNRKESERFLSVCLKYYLKVGKYYIAYSDQGEVLGIALWNKPKGKYINTTNVIKSGMLNVKRLRYNSTASP